MTDDDGLRTRLTRQGEDALGRLAQDLLENPLVSGAITRAFDAGQKAAQAQEVALGALNIPSAADIERLTRRLRSVSQRLEGIEDGVDRLDEHVQAVSRAQTLGERLDRIEGRLDGIARELSDLRGGLSDRVEPMPAGQQRLKVGKAASARRGARRR
jgi:tetrahydromethanopterin S-methyltransferase subunit G